MGEPTEAKLDDFFNGKAVRLNAELFRSPPPEQKPDLPPSDEVNISLSETQGTISSSGPDYRVERGFELREILSKVMGTGPSRIEFAASA